jgi:hypothetical protein
MGIWNSGDLSARIFLLAIVWAGSFGCANDTVRIDSRDTITAAGRITARVYAPQAREEEASARIVEWTGITVDGEVAYQAAADRQNVAAGRQVSLDGTTIAGPTNIRSRARLIDTTANARTGFSVADLFRLEALGGFEILATETALSGAGLQTTDRRTFGGVFAGVRAGLRPHEMIEFYGLGSLGFLASAKGDGASLRVTKLEVGARIMPVEYLGLFAGYRWSDYWQDRDHDESDVDLELYGPVLGLELRF